MSRVMMADLALFTHSKVEVFKRPFSLVDRENKVWDVATDQAVFVAVRRRAQFPRFKGDGWELVQMLTWIQGPVEDPHSIRPSDLLQWVGPSPGGCGVILGVSVDLVRLSKLLVSAPAKKVTLWRPEDLVKDPRCLAFEVGGKWRALLMGQDKVNEGLPSFDLD